MGDYKRRLVYISRLFNEKRQVKWRTWSDWSPSTRMFTKVHIINVHKLPHKTVHNSSYLFTFFHHPFTLFICFLQKPDAKAGFLSVKSAVWRWPVRDLDLSCRYSDSACSTTPIGKVWWKKFSMSKTRFFRKRYEKQMKSKVLFSEHALLTFLTSTRRCFIIHTQKMCWL